MKNILIITLEYPPVIGGIATYVRQLARALYAGQVTVLAPFHIDAETIDSQESFSIHRDHLYWPRFVWPRWGKLFFITRRIVRERKIEMLYVHHALPVGYIAWLLKKTMNIPYVLFSHGTDIVAGTKNTWKTRLMTMVVREAEQVIVNSESLGRRLVERVPIAEGKITVLYPCPDEIFLQPVDPGAVTKLRYDLAVEGKQVLLSIGRLADGKGFPHLLRLIPELLTHVPHLVWCVIGDGPKKEALMEEVQKHHLQNVVRFIGEVPQTALPTYYALADVFALLTHPDEGREEGLGLVFLEAAAAGVPAVAGRSGGVEEAVIHAKTGLVVDTYQDASVISAISYVFHDRAYAQKLAQEAKDRVRADFRWEHQVARLDPWR